MKTHQANKSKIFQNPTSRKFFGEQFRKHLLATTVMTVASVLVSSTAFAVPTAYETPTGFDLQAGDVTDPVLSGYNDRNMNLTQDSDRAVIDWDTFNIGKRASVNFNQTQGASSLVVNRVDSNGGIAKIYGKLKAQGKVMILDQNGVFFGKTARIDVGGIIASTGSLANPDMEAFVNSNGSFDLNVPDNTASVRNNADFTVAESGLVAFVAPWVVNRGTITAKLGKVTLASGKKVTVDFVGNELISIAVGREGELGNALIRNSGKIIANGGRVTLTARAAAGLVNNVINMRGIIRANRVDETDGKIILSG
ncbi:MAG: filamentous hemagglutinin N-terminal domain-containing protein, partial [Alphaproteobacteria bacterium]|nr:filamentous hemagglutinin N-terminal domain-containing protein [Alphaproteobacteria bacterium]